VARNLAVGRHGNLRRCATYHRIRAGIHQVVTRSPIEIHQSQRICRSPQFCLDRKPWTTAMEPDTFLIAWHRGHWRIGYDGRWYGPYETEVAAAISAIRIARAAPKTRVGVKRTDQKKSSGRSGRPPISRLPVWELKSAVPIHTVDARAAVNLSNRR
jgi:hypothetical protein